MYVRCLQILVVALEECFAKNKGSERAQRISFRRQWKKLNRRRSTAAHGEEKLSRSLRQEKRASILREANSEYGNLGDAVVDVPFILWQRCKSKHQAPLQREKKLIFFILLREVRQSCPRLRKNTGKFSGRCLTGLESSK